MPVFYAYFTAHERKYTLAQGTVHSKSSIAAYGNITNADVYLHIARVTDHPLRANEQLNRTIEYVAIVNDESLLPAGMGTLCGYDAQGNPYPAHGVFVRIETSYPGGLNGIAHVGREMYQEVSDLDNVGPFNTPHDLYKAVAEGLRDETLEPRSTRYEVGGDLHAEAISWLGTTALRQFNPKEDANWHPGDAGPFERFLFGSGKMAQDLDYTTWPTTNPTELYFVVYALQEYLIVEFWHEGQLVADRALDCEALTRIGTAGTYTIGFGYDTVRGLVSLGVNGAASGIGSSSAYKEWKVPEIVGKTINQHYLAYGGDEFQYGSGVSGHRTAWANLKPVVGAVADDEYMTRGKMSVLAEDLGVA